MSLTNNIQKHICDELKEFHHKDMTKVVWCAPVYNIEPPDHNSFVIKKAGYWFGVANKPLWNPIFNFYDALNLIIHHKDILVKCQNSNITIVYKSNTLASVTVGRKKDLRKLYCLAICKALLRYKMIVHGTDLKVLVTHLQQEINKVTTKKGK